MKKWFLLLLVALLPSLGRPVFSWAAELRPKVLVDRSHEWLFAYDDLGDRMLRPAGFEVVLCDASLGEKMPLDNFDVVMVQQAHCKFPFSSSEVQLLTEYVRGGGNLVLIGNPTCPISKVASSFGIQFFRHKGRIPARSTPYLLRHGADPQLQTRAIRYCVRCNGQGTALIVDGAGQALALAIDYGQGHVVAFADDLSYWDFCAQRDSAMRVPNTQTTLAIFKGLLSDPPPLGAGPLVQRVTGELLIRLDSITVRYSNPVTDKVDPLLKQLPEIEVLVAKANGILLPYDRLIVNLLATDGGGYSGGREIGVMSGGDMGANIAVIAHEMTHSFEGPLPGILSEGWASLVGMRAALALGYPTAAKKERQVWEKQYRDAERRLGRLDLGIPEVERAVFGAFEGKMMSCIEGFERLYGDDFMPRFLELKWAIKDRDEVSMQETLWLFSLAAGQDLTKLYQNLGITYRYSPSLSAEEVQTRLAAYRRKVAK